MRKEHFSTLSFYKVSSNQISKWQTHYKKENQEQIFLMNTGILVKVKLTNINKNNKLWPLALSQECKASFTFEFYLTIFKNKEKKKNKEKNPYDHIHRCRESIWQISILIHDRNF